MLHSVLRYIKIQMQDMHDIKQLTLIFVQALYLDIKYGIRVHRNAFGALYIFRKAQLIVFLYSFQLIKEAVGGYLLLKLSNARHIVYPFGSTQGSAYKLRKLRV